MDYNILTLDNVKPYYQHLRIIAMIEIRQKSPVPVYGAAAAWVLYCVLFPLYKSWHFIALACTAALAYAALSAIFPGKTKVIEAEAEPARTGDDRADALLAEGEGAVAELRRLRDAVPDAAVRGKVDEIVFVVDRIFKNLLDNPGNFNQIKRFAGFFLPATIKLLHTYDTFGQSGARGENISGTMGRIDAALDTILASYRKFFDSLFENQAIDIETDIRVLENMLRKEGLMTSEFDNQ